MSGRYLCGFLVGFVVLSASLVNGQDCGCAAPAVGGHRHFWPGPYGGPNCGRAYNQAQAESLWAGYCTEDCSLCTGGLGAGCGVGCSNGCGGSCGHAAGPFAHLPHVNQHAHGFFGHRSGHSGAAPFAGGPFAKFGHHHQATAGGCAPCSMGGKACGRSIFQCQQWGWGNCGSGCGCGGCDSGNGGLCGQLHEVGKCGRLFKSTGCDSNCQTGCDTGCDSSVNPGSYSNPQQLTEPHQTATPTGFHRYH